MIDPTTILRVLASAGLHTDAMEAVAAALKRAGMAGGPGATNSGK